MQISTQWLICIFKSNILENLYYQIFFLIINVINQLGQ